MHLLKIASLTLFSFVPGRIGTNAETRRLRRLRARASDRALQQFDSVLGSLGSDAICLDLGANVGEFTEKMAAQVAHVYAFEPDPWAFERLRARVEGLANVTLINAAIGTGDGTAVIRRAPEFDENPAEWSIQTSVLELTPGLDVGEMIEVPLIDFLRFVRELDRRVAVVKVDIEGAEVPLLEALLDAPELGLIDALFVETHEINMPALRPRIARLRRRVAKLQSPIVNLDWP